MCLAYKMHNGLNAHVPADAVGHEERNSSCRLRQRDNCIHQRMQEPTGCRSAEQHSGETSRWIRHHVQPTKDHERRNVLNVIKMRSVNTISYLTSYKYTLF